MKRVAIHQPEFCPYVGFFNKMMNADEFVILDNVQFKKNNYQNRNRISLNGQEKWLTIPVTLDDHLHTKIPDIKIADHLPWSTKVFNLLHAAYREYPYYREICSLMHECISECDGTIFDLNMLIIALIRRYLVLDTPLIYSSNLDIDSAKSELVLDICRDRGADIYLSGSGGKTYLDTDKFTSEGIEIQYPVRSNEYNLSIIDLMMKADRDYVRDFVKNFAYYEKEDT